MSKRYGNILTVRDLREHGADAGAVRHFLFNTHYRQKLDWRDEALAAAREGSARLGAFRDRLELAGGSVDDSEAVMAAERVPGWDSPARWTTTSTPPRPWPPCTCSSGKGTGCWTRRRLGPAFRAAWSLADDVLAVAPTRPGENGRCGALAVAEEDGTPVRPPEVPPPDAADGEAWALRWAAVRAAEKRARNFGGGGPIRDLLKEAGWDDPRPAGRGDRGGRRLRSGLDPEHSLGGADQRRRIVRLREKRPVHPVEQGGVGEAAHPSRDEQHGNAGGSG